MMEGKKDGGTCNGRPPAPKDPRSIARKYQLDICKKAVEENTIVYLGTGCGKTHIAVLLMYELAHLFRKPKRNVCVFLAPTIPLVRQQALVIENSTDFKVQTYFGSSRQLKTHSSWEQEIEQYEVLVMTPLILLHNLRHCFIRMELVTLLIFDECHHAQLHKRHPYAQIMKEFYEFKTTQRPRIFGMTASPIVGKGGSNRQDFAKSINSLEHLLDAKVHVVEDDVELESIVPSAEVKVYFYRRFNMSNTNAVSQYLVELEKLKDHCSSIEREKLTDPEFHRKRMKLLLRVHDSLIYCLDNVGLSGAIQAARILSTSDSADVIETELDTGSNDSCLLEYLNGSIALLNCKLNDLHESNELPLHALEEPFFSKKLLILIMILQKYKDKPNIRSIVFVKRIIIAKVLTHILKNLNCLDVWRCDLLVGCHSGSMSRNSVNKIVEEFSSGMVNLLVATNIAEEGLDIQTCSLVIRFDLPETVASYIQSRGRARMSKSEYAFIVERGNNREERLLEEFRLSEDVMNRELMRRTSSDLFDYVDETTYTVNATGASISTGCSVSLLHHYCSKLPHDEFFNPMPKFSYIDDLLGTVCRIVLPSNSPVRLVESDPLRSRDEAKRSACLKACVELRTRGALSDFLLPNTEIDKKTSPGGSSSLCGQDEDQCLREELHEMLVPTILTVPWSKLDSFDCLHFYHIRFVPIPEDRGYRKFGLFLKSPLPKEAESMEVDLHLAHGRMVKTRLVPSGTRRFNKEEILFAENFQEMCLRIILDRSEFKAGFVSLGAHQMSNLGTFYLLLPLMQHSSSPHMIVDWNTIQICLSSPVFSQVESNESSTRNASETLELVHGPAYKKHVLNSLVYVPISGTFYFIDGILTDITGHSNMNCYKKFSYYEYYKSKFAIALMHPEQALLKAKQVFCVHNLLCNRLQDNTVAREIEERFVELPPELCQLKVIGFSKDIGSSLSLLPSFMHRLQNLLVAVELKSVLLSSFAADSKISSFRIFEALTTEKCLERFSLERLEILGDAFLKYVVGRHIFLSCDALDEGQLTKARSKCINNSNLYDLAVKKKLQVYICDEMFNPANFFAFGRPCRVLCNHDEKASLDTSHGQSGKLDWSDTKYTKCHRYHRWLHRKTIADVVEALVGAFLVDSGFKATIAFLQWLGVAGNYDAADVESAWEESRRNMSLINDIDIAELEMKLGYSFQHKGLLIQAFIHPSFIKHSGGCYQRLEFLGDAVMDYLITSYVFSAYPDLKPGQLSDLRSITVSNASFARISVEHSFHEYVMKDSRILAQAINRFERYACMTDIEKDLMEEPATPKVLGDIVESCIGAVLLDSGFNMTCVWNIMLTLFDSVLKFSGFQISPIRELMELCQVCDFQLNFPQPIKDRGMFVVEVDVVAKDRSLQCRSINLNSKTARRLAAKEMTSRLKGLGYKHKNKSLEEVLLTTRKEKPKLIGFDEEPILVKEFVNAIQLEKLQFKEQKPKKSGLSEAPISVRDVTDAIQFEKLQLEDLEKFSMQKATYVDFSKENFDKTSSSSPSTSKAAPECANRNSPFNNSKQVKASARSRLFEICTTNYWSPPSFVCFKEEGLSHLKMFTYKVTVQVGGSPNMTLECFSEPQQKKKAAQEHAAEGAIWYLKHQGYAQVQSINPSKKREKEFWFIQSLIASKWIGF